MLVRGMNRELIGERLLYAARGARRLIDRRAPLLLALAALLVVAILTTVALVKFDRFGYDGLDLAIYTQTVHESAQGNLFGLTIHPHSYLGDHVELILLALVPIYALFAAPQTLLIIQILALASGAFAVYAIGRCFLSRSASLAVALAYLLSPLVGNAALFEFHALPFAIPLLLAAAYGYLRRRFGFFLLFAVLALTVREDVALVVAAFGLVALIDRRRWYWTAAPLALGAAWFAASLHLAASLNAYDQYKYLRYYGWLGENAGDIVVNFFRHPLRWLPRLVSLWDLEFLLGAFLPLLFLPLLRPKWLVPALPILFQLLLLNSSGEQLLQIHYPALLVPFLFIATIAAVRSLAMGGKTRLMAKLAHWRRGIIAFLPVAALYFAVVLGPFWSAPREAVRPFDREDIAMQDAFVALVPKDAPLATTFIPLQKTAERSRVYSLNYVFLGRKQFSELPYELPADAAYLLIDLDDLTGFDLIYTDTDYRGKRGFERIQEVIDRGFALVAWEDHLTLWQRGPGTAAAALVAHPVAALAYSAPIRMDGRIAFLGSLGRDGTAVLTAERSPIAPHPAVLPLSLVWQATEKMDKDYELAFRLYRGNALAYEKFFPLASGLFPSSAWAVGEPVRTNYRFRIPAQLKPGSYEVRIALVNLKAHTGLDGWRSIDFRSTVDETLGGELSLGSISLPASTR